MRRARPALGTIVDIAIDAAPGVDQAAAIDAAFASVETLEAQLSVHRPDSDLNRACASAHRRPVMLEPALFEVLKLSLDLYRQSQGIFDVTLMPARWADSAAPQLAGSSADIELNDDRMVFFARPLRLDLGGIAKGYIVDCVVELLQARGIRSGRVNAGGDLRVFGDITEPVSLRFADGFRTVAQICDGAFAASASGARPMADAEAADQPRHFDGRSRQPVSGPDTVAVFAGRAMIADALTKIALANPATADALCPLYSAQWRRYPYQLALH